MRKPLTFRTWNVRFLLDRVDRPDRLIAVIVWMLGRYQIDIAALSGTRFSEEVVGGYPFFCMGKPEDVPMTSGVGFAIRTMLARQLDSLLYDRLMTLHLKLTKDCFATMISAYLPTMTNSTDMKEAFYEDINHVILEVNTKGKLIILGDFNA